MPTSLGAELTAAGYTADAVWVEVGSFLGMPIILTIVIVMTAAFLVPRIIRRVVQAIRAAG